MSRPKKEIRPGPKVAAVKAVIDRLTSEKVKENEEARKKKEVCVCLSSLLPCPIEAKYSKVSSVQ